MVVPLAVGVLVVVIVLVWAGVVLVDVRVDVLDGVGVVRLVLVRVFCDVVVDVLVVFEAVGVVVMGTSEYRKIS